LSRGRQPSLAGSSNLSCHVKLAAQTEVALAKTKQTSFARLRMAALSYPETDEEFPWGESAIKVRGKTFVFMRDNDGELSLSVKLPQSHEFALEYPFTAPTGYGLGKSGWVTARFDRKRKPPLDVLEAWIGESYRAVAPKRLVKTLDPKPRE
jgi:predicted DNA-binding protein (MmcQ/YjbR family)